MTGRQAQRLARGGAAIRIGAALAVTLAGALAADGSQHDRRFTTSAGHQVTLTPVDRMDCLSLARKLAEIDATGYRGANPRPAERGDRPLFDYEKAVSRRYYTTCNAGGAAKTTEAFRGGFRVPRRSD